MNVLHGLLSWSHRGALSLREVGDDKKRFQMALDAEDELGSIVKDLGHLADHVHLRKRVYVPEAQRSREIDVIAVCSSLYVVEVKNWSGKVWRNGPRWFQMPPRNNARALEFNDVLEECEYKAKALVKFLQRKGIELPAGSVKAVVVFASDRVKLDPETLGNCPSVFTKSQFKELVEQRSAVHDTLTSYAPWFFAGRSELTPPLRRKVNEALAVVRTWDAVVMHNGERYQGDLKWIKLPEYTAWGHARDRESGLNVNRKDIQEVDLSWASSAWHGVFSAMWQGSAGVLRLTVSSGMHASLVEGGRDGPKGVAGKDKSKNAGGKRKDGGDGGEQSSQQLGPPPVHVISLSTRSTHKKTIEVNHVVFHPAGQVGPSVFPLSEVASLELGGLRSEDSRNSSPKSSPTTSAPTARRT